MTIYGYIRISTPKQNLQRQKDNILREVPNALIIEEIYTGKTMARPKWEKLYNKLVKGDIVYFDEVSRMSRNTEEGFYEYEELYRRGVDLVFLKEQYVSTTTFKNAINNRIESIKTGNAVADKLINTIFEALNEYSLDIAKENIKQAFEHGQRELEFLGARTKEGLKPIKQKRSEEIALYGKAKTPLGRPSGNYITKKEIESKKIIKDKSIDFNGTNTDSEVIKLCGISRASFYKYKREVRKEYIEERLKSL